MASYKPDGRRKDYWVFRRRSALNILGEVTIVLSKKRRNQGPKGVKIIGTNLIGASATEILSSYARRWGIELTIKELKRGLHFGPMPVTKDKDRVTRSAALSVLAYLLLLRLYSQEESGKEGWSLSQLKQRFIAEVYQEQGQRSEQRWRQKLDHDRLAS